ncbi:MAG: endonuclease/exonuclease/phosphatase family protein [Myxococcales bacterium]|nr:endonuclease/exonuclease/phosphatase family protein [Myxococcales bacterium]
MTIAESRPPDRETPARASPRARRGALSRLLRAAALALTVASVLPLAGRWHWTFDLFAHFPAYYAGLLAIVMLALALRRQALLCALLTAPLLLNLAALAPVMLGAAAPAGAGPRVRILHLNVLGPNRDTARALAELRTREVDLLVIEELRPHWSAALRELPGYSFVVDHPRADNFGLALLRRDDAPLRIDAAQVIEEPGLPPMIDATITALPEGDADPNAEALSLSLLAAHPHPPAPAWRFAARDALFDYAAAWAIRERARGRAPVLIGDLNATPFSPVLRQLCARAGLVNSQRGHGYQGTFPATLPVLPIPIDHALHDPSLTTTRRRVGPAVGSDHLPLELELAPARAAGSG